MLLPLTTYQAPDLMTISSFKRGIGPASSVARDRNATISIYDTTRAGQVRVYIIDDVASLLPPKGRQ